MGTLTAIGFCLLVWGAAVGGFAMAKHLHLPCPSQKEEIAEGGIVAPSDDDMQASLHEGGIETEDDGAARVIAHVVEHGGEVAAVVAAVRVGEADGVVVVVIEEGAIFALHREIGNGTLLLSHAGDFLAPAGADNSPGKLTIANRARRLEILDNSSKALIHPLPHFYHAVEVIGHTDGGMEGDVTAFGGLNGGGLVPFIHNGRAKGGEMNGGITGIHVQFAEETITIPHHKGDEVYAFVVIIMAGVMGTVEQSELIDN